MFTTVGEKTSQEISSALRGTGQTNPSCQKNWFGRTVDHGWNFVESYGRGSLLLGFIPSFTLLVSSTNVKNLVVTSSCGFVFTVFIQHAWRYFDRSNQEKIHQEQTWCKNNLGYPKMLETEAANGFSAVREFAINSYRRQRAQAPVEDPQIPEMDRINFIGKIINLDEDPHFQQQCKLIETGFEDINKTQEKIEIQVFLDKFSDLISKVHEERAKELLVSEKSTQEMLEDANNCAQGFKGMTLALKISKELIQLGKNGNLKFKGEELLKELHEKYYKATTLSKFNIEIITIAVEYFCIYTRDEEIKALKDHIIELERQKNILESEPQLQKSKYAKNCAAAMKVSIESIEKRVEYLVQKNNSKQRGMTFDIVEVALTGSQDTFELAREKTTFFANFPKLLNWLIAVDASIGIFISLVSFVFNMIKVCLSKIKFENAGIDEVFCKKLLEDYRSEWSEKYFKVHGRKPQNEELIDNYTRFLELKIKVLEKSKLKRVIHIIEKIIKISDDLVTLAASTKLLISLIGITLGAPIVTVLTTATTTVTVLSLGSGFYRFSRKLYSQRHRIVYACAMVYLKSSRTPQFERLVKVTNDIQETAQSLECSEESLNTYEDDLKTFITDHRFNRNSSLDGTETELDLVLSEQEVDHLSLDEKNYYLRLQQERKKSEDKKNEFGKRLMDLYKASESTYLCYEEIIKKVGIVRDSLFANEMAEHVDTYSASDIVSFRNFLNEELGLTKSQDGKNSEGNSIVNRAIWGERLRLLGYTNMNKPVTGEHILKCAFSTLPMTETSRNKLSVFRKKLDKSHPNLAKMREKKDPS